MKNYIELEAKLKAVPVSVRSDISEMADYTEAVMFADGVPVAYIRKHEDCPYDVYEKCLKHISSFGI